MPQITARDTATGKTVTFNWNGDGQPTESDMADVFKAAQGEAYKPSGPQPRGWQPIGSHGGAQPEGAQKSGLLSALEPVAHPSLMSDFASLLIPSAALGTGLRSLRGWVGAGKNLFQGAAEGSANREGLKKLPSVLRGMSRVAGSEPTDISLDRYMPNAGGYEASGPLSRARIETTVTGPQRAHSPFGSRIAYGAADAAETATSTLSDSERAALAKQGYTPDLIDKIAGADQGKSMFSRLVKIGPETP